MNEWKKLTQNDLILFVSFCFWFCFVVFFLCFFLFVVVVCLFLFCFVCCCFFDQLCMHEAHVTQRKHESDNDENKMCCHIGLHRFGML